MLDAAAGWLALIILLGWYGLRRLAARTTREEGIIKVMEKTAQDLLRDAANVVEAALGKLDASREGCGECSLEHYKNKTQGRVHEQLSGLPDKLRRASDRLDANEG